MTHGDGLAQEEQVPNVRLPLGDQLQLLRGRVLIAMDFWLLPTHDERAALLFASRSQFFFVLKAKL